MQPSGSPFLKIKNIKIVFFLKSIRRRKCFYLKKKELKDEKRLKDEELNSIVFFSEKIEGNMERRTKRMKK